MVSPQCLLNDITDCLRRRYFEARINSSGKCQIGWATTDMEPAKPSDGYATLRCILVADELVAALEMTSIRGPLTFRCRACTPGALTFRSVASGPRSVQTAMFSV